jgi:hypothetical protein
LTQPKSKKGGSTPAVTAYLAVMEEASHILQCKRCLIDTAMSGISSRYGKPLDLAQIRANAPCKLLDDLMRAVHFDSRYTAVATSLCEYLIEDVTSTLRSVHVYVETNAPSLEEEWRVPMKALRADSMVPRSVNGDSGRSPWVPKGLSAFKITSIDDCEDLMENIEMFTPYFPLQVFERYQSELATTKQTIKNARKVHKERIKEATSADANDCHKSLGMFRQYVEKRDFMNMKNLGDRMNKQFELLAQDVKIDLKAGKLSAVLDALTHSYQDWMSYTATLMEWNKNHSYYSCYLVKQIGSFFSMSPYTEVTFDVKPPIVTRRVLHQAISESVNRAITGIESATPSQLAELEPLFDGLIAFLHPSKNGIWDEIMKTNKNLRQRASGAIIAIGRLFASILHQISTSIEKITVIMTDTSYERVRSVHALCDDLAAASNLVAFARDGAALCTKLKDLCVSSKDPCYNQLRTMEILTSDEMNARLNITIEIIQQVAKPSLLDNQLLITPNASDRNSFYRRVQVAVTLLIRWDGDQAIANGCVNNRANEESCRDKISSEIELIGAAADRLIGSTEYERLGMLYDNLRSISENLSDRTLKDRSIGRMKSIDGLFYQRIDIMKRNGWLNDAEWNSQPFDDSLYEKVANELINMKTATTHISHCKKHIDEEYIDKLLKDYKSRPTGAAGASFFLGLSIYLGGIRTSNAPIASQILADHAAFTGHKLLIRNERILRFTVEDTMHSITGDDETTSGQKLDQATKNRLVQISRLFEEEYWSLVEVGLEGVMFPHAELESIVRKTEEIAKKRGIPQKQKIRSLMAHVFAYWTLSESKHYQEAKAQKKKKNARPSAVKKNTSLLQPHSGQIVGIIRLLGLDEEDPGDVFQGTPPLFAYLTHQYNLNN